jgi:hypothetical protein
MKNCRVPLLFVLAAASTAAVAAERSIVVPAKVTASWGYLTQSTVVKPSRTMGVGFWQRGSGAKPGVGEQFVSAMEFQLPEAAPSRVRRATFQFSGKPSQCIGAEPVVVNVHAYAADGRADIGDATAGPKVAQMRADCTDHAAFSQPIDVTHVVRQASVASGVRFVGFNVRTANNRQGPGLFALAPGTLTVVLADEHVDAYPAARAGTPSHIDPHAVQSKSALAANSIGAAAVAGVVPATFHGNWVPAKAACDSPLRLTVGGDRLMLANGGDRESLRGIDMAGPGYFPPSYSGIMAVLITEFDGQQPATMTFNLREKKGVAQIEFSPVMPGKATPQLTAYNKRITQLGLAKRFPIDKVALKRCAATSG